MPSRAHSPSVRSGLQPRPSMRTSATAVIDERDGIRRAEDGYVELEDAGADVSGLVEQGVEGEEGRQVGDDAHHGRGDAGQGRGEVRVVSQPLDVRRPEQHEQEARHERHPADQQRREHGRDPRVERARVAVGAEEGDELDHHDQRTGGRLGERQSAHHLPRCQPAVDVDRLLGDVGQDGVGAAEGDDRGAGEEQGLVDEHRRRRTPRARRRRRAPTQIARPTTRISTDRRRDGRLVVQRVVADQRRRPVGAGPLAAGAGGRGTGDRRASRTHRRARITIGNGYREEGERDEGRHGQHDQRRVGQGPLADPVDGLDDDGDDGRSQRPRRPRSRRPSSRTPT